MTRRKVAEGRKTSVEPALERAQGGDSAPVHRSSHSEPAHIPSPPQTRTFRHVRDMVPDGVADSRSSSLPSPALQLGAHWYLCEAAGIPSEW